ncbi:carbohydrate esterase family 4 protein [Auriculariales sp. MPI-PUGE-AT-0066]|nr:carbohydrate esterase family 4 protein [Auriculariales sp. MPI-PUGE-AT-0066]
MIFLTTTILLAAAAASAHPHVGRAVANGAWYQERDHPINSLFARAPGPDIGTHEWAAQYPSYGKPSQTDIPAEWLAAYNAAKDAGKIPTAASQNGQHACNSGNMCRADGDIWDAPEGKIVYSFDDGPSMGTDTLLDFLATTNTTCTHFFIGSNIALYPQRAIRAFQQGDELAVHTWTHPRMTNETDLGVVVELGWTMQIIHDVTGGRVPRFWRPPYGDMDNRVRAIAKEVFGLTPVIWNYDTQDWTLGNRVSATTENRIEQWLSGSKKTGLNILEHELTEANVEMWINGTYAGANRYGWEGAAVGPTFGLSSYQNAQDDKSTVNQQDNMAAVPVDVGGATSTSGSQEPTSSADSPGATTSTPPAGAATRHTAALSSLVFAALSAAVFW